MTSLNCCLRNSYSRTNGTYSGKNGKIWKYTDLFYSVDITKNVLLRMFYTFYIYVSEVYPKGINILDLDTTRANNVLKKRKDYTF